MAFYLVRGRLRAELYDELRDNLEHGAFRGLRPFGRALSGSLEAARRQPDGTAVWEEEDYCSPPLAQERAAVLDRYFTGLRMEAVDKGAGWEKIDALPRLFPGLSARKG